jgi:CHRD domain
MLTQRKRLFIFAVAMSAAGAVVAAGSAATASNKTHEVAVTVNERLSGYEETPLAVSTGATGRFRARIDERQQRITYSVSYSGLEGNVTQAHIHFGARAQTGGIAAFLCTNLGNGPEGTQACPAAPATVSGTLQPADILGPSAQGIAAGEFAELVSAIRAGFAYVNVHSTLWPVGELRAQFDRH